MARNSRVRGPTGIFTMPVPFTPVTGMSISRPWDDGPILLLARARMSNAGAASVNFCLQIWEDGTSISGVPMCQDIPAGSAAVIAHGHLHLPSAGAHTYQLAGSADGAATSRLVAGGAELIAIQFPRWDQEDGLITL